VRVRPGVVGLLGPNGAGKSTLIKLLLGLVRLSSGHAAVLGLDVRRESRRIRELVGYMPEDDCFIAGLKGVELVAYCGQIAGLPPRTALRRAHEILDYVRLGDERYREVQTYSTGMKQRVKLAQSLIHSPRLVFLDEPTSGLDPSGREHLLRLIRNLGRDKGVSVVLSTHILHDVEECCDAVLILSRGKLMVYDELERLQRAVDDSYEVRFSGDRDRFQEALLARGLEVQALEAGSLRLAGGSGDLAAAAFQAACETGVALRQLSPSRNSLEEIFLEAIKTGPHDAHL